MNFHGFIGPAAAAALLLAAAGCNSAPMPPTSAEVAPPHRKERLTSAMACELGATGTLTSLFCIHQGVGADLGLSPDPSNFRF